MGLPLVFDSHDVFWFGSLYVSLLNFPIFLFHRVCTGIEQVLLQTWTIEIAVDVFWLINIYFCFTTSFFHEMEEVKSWRKIAKRYLFDSFAIDFITTVPALVTYNKVE